MDDRQIQELLEALKKMSDGGGRLGEVPINDAVKFKKYIEDLNKTVDRSRTTMGSFVKEMVTGKKRYVDLSATIEDLDEQIEELSQTFSETNLKEIQALKDKREQLVSIQRTNVAFQALGGVMSTFGQGITNSIRIIAQGARTVARDITGGADIFTTVADAMDVQLDIQNEMVKTLASGANIAGSALMTLGPVGIAVGAALQLAAFAATTYSEMMTEAQKFYNHFVLTEGSKILKAFQTMSSAGAMYAGGATTMGNLARQAGLSLEQFSNSVQKNAHNLAISGVGVSEGAELMSNAMRHLTDNGGKASRQLLNLGYTFEEQADLYAETMADMRRANDPQIKDSTVVHERTMRYAENLRVLADLTGEDAKKKMEEARQSMYELAFRAKLQEVYKDHPEKIQEVTTALASMPPMYQKQIMQQVALGVVVDKSANILKASIPGVGMGLDKMANSISNGTFNLQENQRLQGQTNDELRKNLGSIANLGVASIAGVGGVAGQFTSDMRPTLENMDKISSESVRRSQEDAAKQKNTNDKLTGTIVEATRAGQAMKIHLESLARNELPKFRTAIGETIMFIESMINKAAGMASNQQPELKKPSHMVETGSKWAAGLGILATLIGGGLTATGFGATVGVPLMMGGIASALGGGAGYAGGKYLEDKGFADGGISRGPVTGHRELLHGTEAVIPLPDGKSVPISFPMDELTSRLADVMGGDSIHKMTDEKLSMLIDKIDKMTTAMRPTSLSGTMGGPDSMTKDLIDGIEMMSRMMDKQLSKHDEIIEVLNASKEINRKILNVSM